MLVGMIWGDERAQAIQLAMEYDPQPPYDAGSPRRGGDARLAAVTKPRARSD